MAPLTWATRAEVRMDQEMLDRIIAVTILSSISWSIRTSARLAHVKGAMRAGRRPTRAPEADTPARRSNPKNPKFA